MFVRVIDFVPSWRYLLSCSTSRNYFYPHYEWVLKYINCCQKSAFCFTSTTHTQHTSMWRKNLKEKLLNEACGSAVPLQRAHHAFFLQIKNRIVSRGYFSFNDRGVRSEVNFLDSEQYFSVPLVLSSRKGFKNPKIENFSLLFPSAFRTRRFFSSRSEEIPHYSKWHWCFVFHHHS